MRAKGSVNGYYQRKRASEANQKTKDESQKKRMSESAILRSKKLVVCQRCGFIGSGPAMNRWHGANCRSVSTF
jgi:hypothetical protein